MIVQPVILCGGAGTRLWPLSREQYPKQLLAFQGERTLLQDTVNRLAGLPDQMLEVADPIVVCNEEHRFLVAEQLRHIDQQASTILLEPVGRNTAPALTVAALASVEKNQDVILLVMPADHVINLPEKFHQAVKVAADLAERGNLVTFGIVPTSAETGYGYLCIGEPLVPVNQRALSPALSPQSYFLSAFVEKPDEVTACGYLASKEYLWNSGMFVLRSSVWLEHITQLRPDIEQACGKAFRQATQDLDFCRLDREAFSACPSDSIDYAVMEKICGQDTSLVAVVPLEAGWSDLGAWTALWEVSNRDEDGNSKRGDVLTHDCCNSLFRSEHRLVAGVGLENLLVVETADAVLVAHRDHAQDVKQVVAQLKTQQRPERLVHRQVFRPWGSYEGVVAAERFQVKRIVVKPGAELSLQMHHHRAEHWIVVKGTAKVTCGDEVFLLSENQSTYIPIGEKHRLENPGNLPLEIIEVQSGSYLGEDDIVRFEDRYGRSD